MPRPTILKETILSSLKTELGDSREVALAIFPNHWNVGDSALWWATCVALDELGIKIVYACHYKTYSPESLVKHTPKDAPILLCGGGNFGDVYFDEQGLREKILINHRDYKVVQLPQSIWFKSDTERERISNIARQHPRLSVWLRDSQSLKIAQSLHLPNTKLCPDMAFCLVSHLKKVVLASYPLTVLKRDDGESKKPFPDFFNSKGVRVYDWHEENDEYRSTWSWQGKLAYYIVQKWIDGKNVPMRIIVWATCRLSKERTLAGIKTIGDSECLISDRLHAGILSLLIGQKTIIVDNSYGKNKALYSTWLADEEKVSLVESFEEGIERIDIPLS